MSRLPIRVKLTLAFAGVMAVVLAATGLFVYLRLDSELDASLNNGLRSRASDVRTLVHDGNASPAEAGRSPLGEAGETFAQVLDARGQVVNATRQLQGRPLLRGRELRRALAGPETIDRDDAVEAGEPARLLATPVTSGGQRFVVVVGAPLDDKTESLRSLLAVLTIGGLGALLLASLAGYGVAAAALRPVEAMRSKAAAITDSEPGERLPVPTARDEIARLGATLNQMLERLEAGIARERAFVSDASHELRTPLAILKTELELALRRARTPEELRDSLRSASEETERLARLAEDLLVIARADGGRLPLKVTTIDVTSLLGGLAERFDGRLGEAERSLVVGSTPGLRLEADPLRVEQALGNMLDNALRHGKGEIRMEAEALNGHVELHVRDRGQGFPPAFVAVAFERFTRADEARTGGGAGLGLAIVEAIAEAHGGRARAVNRPEGGADVWIEL